MESSSGEHVFVFFFLLYVCVCDGQKLFRGATEDETKSKQE